MLIIITIFSLHLTGISSSDSFSGSETLCTAENFTPSKWLTLGRTDLDDPPHCPLVGEYTGILPDAEGLCARSYADCNNPEVMFYTVFNCANASEVYEEREYRCFGQWTEPSTGLVYTYTERRDIPGKECFVGITMDEDEKHMVTEAGANCERGHQPQKYGMTLMRQSKCQADTPGAVKRIPPKSDGHGGLRIPITTPRSRFESSSGRPISPRLSTVRNVVMVDGVEQLLEKIEEEEEQRYYDREFDANQGQIPRQNRPNRGRKHHKHHHNHNKNQDIFTNEIPGSRTDEPGSAGQAKLWTPLLLLVVALLSLWHN